MSNVRVERLVTSGTFSLDGGTWGVDNNVWIIGNETEAIVIDPAHNVEAVAEAVGARNVNAILLTHGHDDHIRVAVDAKRRLDAPLYMHPADQMLGDTVHDTAPDFELTEGAEFSIGGEQITVVHTSGHGDTTTISDEVPHLQEWIGRCH